MKKDEDWLFHGRSLRPILGGVFGVLLPAIFTALNLGGRSALWENVHWTLATWAMVSFGWLGWHRAEGPTRRVRGWMMAGLISYAIGQLLWDVARGLGNVSFPNLSDLFFLSLGPFIFAAVMLSARSHLSRGDEIALFLDSGMIFLAFATALAMLYIPRAAHLSTWQLTLLIARPGFFLAASGAGLVAALKTHARFAGGSPYLLSGGLGLLGICWGIWNGRFLTGTELSGTGAGYGLSVAYLLIGLGVAIWDLVPSENPNVVGLARQLIRTLPMLAIPLAVVILIWNRSQNDFLNVWIDRGSVGIITLALVRQSLLFWERDRLYLQERAAVRRNALVLAERQVLLDIMRGGIMAANLTEFLALVHHSLDRVIYARNFFVSLYDKSTGLFDEAYSVDQFDQPSGPHALGKSVSAYVFRTGRPLLLAQTQFDDLVARGEVELVGTNSPSWLGVPLQTPTETIGVMVVQHYEKADIYSEQDVELMASIAGQVALMVERKRADEILWDSENRYRTLVENLPIGVYRTTPGEQGTFLMANPAFVRMFGFEAETQVKEVAVSTFYLHPEERKAFSETLLARGRVTGQELSLRKRDGTPVVSSITAQVMYSSQGEPLHFDCTVEDITERKKTEEQLKRRGDEFATLYEITRDLAFQWNLPRLLENVVTQAAALLKTTGGGIYLYDPERNDLCVEVSLGEGFPSGVRLAMGEGLAGRVALTRLPMLIDDYQLWPGRARHYDHIPIRAVMGVPMVFGGDLIGVLLVEHIGEVSTPFTANDVQLLSLMAAQAASAVHNARLFEATRHRLAELEAVYRISTALRTAQNLEEMLPLLLDETLAILNTYVGSIVLYDPTKGGLYPAIGRGWFTEVDPSPISPGEGVVGHVFTVGEVYRMKEFSTDVRPRASARSQIPAGWGGACLPIRTAQDTVGVMFIAVPLPRELSDDEIRLLVTLSEIAGNAIHRTRLFEQTQNIVHRLAALHMIDLAITSSFDLRVSLNVLLEQVISLLKADAAIISRLNRSLQELEFVAGRGLFAAASFKTAVRLGESWAGQVALDRHPISIADLAQASPQNAVFPVTEAFRAYHAVPLLAKGQVKGVLEVFHRQPYQPDREWLNFLQTLGGQAAIALDNAELFTGLQHSNMELTLAYEATIEGWSRALDLRDEETEGHTQRVTETTLRLARLMNISEEELVHIRRGALLHDIGKMGVPDRILLKPGPLTEEEWVIMRRHPEYAYEMLAPIEYLHPALDIPYCHHEKWDGTGYPRGLEKEQIPIAARIFAVVDVWDALRSARHYHAAWREADVRAYLRQESGKHFDPQILEVFLKMLEQADE